MTSDAAGLNPGAADLRPRGTVVLLLASGNDRRWAADKAIELSSEWAASGKRIVLADLHLENPLLHEGLGLENLEGVVDIFLYGASLARIARPVRDGAFYFIPAGTYASDPAEIYHDARWRKLVAGFRDTGATLILFLPEEGADLEGLSSWSSEVIVLGRSTNPGILEELEGLGLGVLGVLTPDAAEPSKPQEADGSSPSPQSEHSDGGLSSPFADSELLERGASRFAADSDIPDGDISSPTSDFEIPERDDSITAPYSELLDSDASGTTLDAEILEYDESSSTPYEAADTDVADTEWADSDLPVRGSPRLEMDSAPGGPTADAALAAPRISSRQPVEVHRAPESELELPPPLVRKRKNEGDNSVILWVIFAIIVFGAAAYLLFALKPELLGLGPGAAAESRVGGELLNSAPAPTPAGANLPYSIQVKAFTSLAAAQQELDVGQRQLASAPFYIAPEEIQGIRYYKIMAGLAPDTAEAMKLRDRLVELGTVDENDGIGALSLIQFTPLAFDLGEYQTLEAAQVRMRAIQALAVPVYTAVLPYSDGTQRWQLYGGAYRDSASAAQMGEILQNTGISARLTTRVGLPAPLPE